MFWGLDCAKLTGYAVLSGADLVEDGVFELEVFNDEPEQRRYLRLLDELGRLERRHGTPDVVAYERFATRNHKTVAQLAGYWACVMAWCESRNISADPVFPQTWRAILSHRRRPKGHDYKAESVAAFESRWGRPPHDHNSAEAAHVALCAWERASF